jgi:TetR/AcrR family transcriptional regulator
MVTNPTKNRILDTAAHLFGEYGKSAVSTAAIARAARVNKAMIFYYFHSKEDLYLAALQKWFGELFNTIQEELKGVEPGLPMIETFVRTHIGYLIERPALVKLIVRELIAWQTDPPLPIKDVVERLGGFRTRLVESIELAKMRGELRQVDPIHTILNIISMDVFVFVGNPIIKLMVPDMDMNKLMNERADHILDLLMNGLRPKPE